MQKTCQSLEGVGGKKMKSLIGKLCAFVSPQNMIGNKEPAIVKFEKLVDKLYSNKDVLNKGRWISCKVTHVSWPLASNTSKV